jgi:hypothetical protein
MNIEEKFPSALAREEKNNYFENFQRIFHFKKGLSLKRNNLIRD